MWIPETQLQHSSLEVDQSLCGETYQWGLHISQNVKRRPSPDIVILFTIPMSLSFTQQGCSQHAIYKGIVYKGRKLNHKDVLYI